MAAGLPELAKVVSRDRAVPPVQSGSEQNFTSTSDETKQGVLRLADYIHRQKKSKIPKDPPQLKMKSFIFAPLPAELLRRGLDTYAWVEDHKSLAIGTCINKHF